MTPEMEALARRAVACKGWRWMRGMSNDQGQTIDCVDLIPGKAYCGEWDADMTALPDLTDPATMGCLLALVREHLEDKGVGAICQDVGIMNGGMMWSLIGEGGEFAGYWTKKAYYTTEAEALVEALEVEP